MKVTSLYGIFKANILCGEVLIMGADLAALAIIIGVVVLAEWLVKDKKPKHFDCCPNCGSKRFHAFVEQEVISQGKVKTTYSANLNPLKPFTLVNKKEKVVRQPVTRNVSKFVCDDCGNIFG